MWYAIICEDIEDSLTLRKQTRPAHLEYLQALQEQGKLLTAGPFPGIDSEDPGENGFSGSLLIVDFESLADASAWAEQDPYKLAGVFKHVTVKPYKKVF